MTKVKFTAANTSHGWYNILFFDNNSMVVQFEDYNEFYPYSKHLKLATFLRWHGTVTMEFSSDIFCSERMKVDISDPSVEGGTVCFNFKRLDETDWREDGF